VSIIEGFKIQGSNVQSFSAGKTKTVWEKALFYKKTKPKIKNSKLANYKPETEVAS
jgi:hypothetical protein